VLDSADFINNEDQPFYIDLRFFIPDVRGIYIIIISRSSIAKDIINLEAVKVGEITSIEAAELFKKSVKLNYIG
jgi:hypothetical protein